MQFWIINISLAFLFSAFFAGIVIPKILLIAFRRQLFDVPDERKIHQCVVPRLGGIAFKPVIFFTIALLLGVNLTLGNVEILTEIGNELLPLIFGFCTLMVLYLVGMADDLIGVRYSAKFFIQILCGLMMIAGGVCISDLHGVFGIHQIPTWVGYPFTILTIIFIINSINLIDGIDGLASGLCSIALLIYGVAFFMLQQHIYAILSFTTLGVLVPFFYYNVFGNAERGRKIFMGDTGSLTIGMMLCFLSLQMMQFSDIGGDNVPNPMVLAFSPLLIPCLDVVRVYLHRVREGKNPFLPDRNHIHHKLLAIGLGQRMAMVTIVSISLLFTLCNILLSKYVGLTWLLIGDMILWTVANIWLRNKINRKL